MSPIPKMLEGKFNAKICTMCDRRIDEDDFRTGSDRDKYVDTGYCQHCIDLEFGDLPNQGLSSINWEDCCRKVLEALPYEDAVELINSSALSNEDKEELKGILNL